MLHLQMVYRLYEKEYCLFLESAGVVRRCGRDKNYLILESVREVLEGWPYLILEEITF